ncbi:MAG: hypothetical protein LM632_07855 [Armatimonadetes bacterium]|nr:hypothetical protein [Armatimonadota bacterium]
MEGEAPAEPRTTANSEWRVASGNGFDHPPEVGGCEIKSRLKPTTWVPRCGLRVVG